MQRLIKIGIVEDNPELRKSLQSMVDAAPGFRCVCACASAEDAFNEMPKAAPDVVLMDIHLPFRSGIACTRRLRDLCPDTQVLILTVYDDRDSIFRALKAGASGYLLKRSSPEDILQAIASVREGGAPMSSQIARKVVASFREPAKKVTSPDETLSEREAEVLSLMSEGHSESEIAEKMHISLNTIKAHRKHIYQKLHVRNRTEMVLKVQK